jgi:hypothetical protein
MDTPKSPNADNDTGPVAEGGARVTASQTEWVRRALYLRTEDLRELERDVAGFMALSGASEAKTSIGYTLERADGLKIDADNCDDLIAKARAGRSRFTKLSIYGRRTSQTARWDQNSVHISIDGDAFGIPGYVSIGGDNPVWVATTASGLLVCIRKLRLWYGGWLRWAGAFALAALANHAGWRLLWHRLYFPTAMALSALASVAVWVLLFWGIPVLFPMALIALGDQEKPCEQALARQKRILLWVPGIVGALALTVAGEIWVVPFVRTVLGK